MMAFDPDAYLAATDPKSGGFNPDAYLQATAPNVGGTESFVRGAAQGASLGYADEATGALEALKDKLGGTSDKDLGDLYRQHREESRQAYDAAEKANPWTYRAGGLAGGAATLAVPGLGEVNAGKLAALGALQGLGSSKADVTEGDIGGAAKDAAFGGGIGLATGKAAPYVTDAIAGGLTKAGGAVAGGLKTGLSAMSGVPVEGIDRYLANRAAVKAAGEKGASGIADDLAGAVSKLKAQLGDDADAAYGKLSPDLFNAPGVADKGAILAKINELQEGLKTQGSVIGQGKNRAYQTLENYKNQIGKMSDGKMGLFDDRIPETGARDLATGMQQDINWNDPEAGVTNDKLKALESFVNQNLQEANPEFGQAMQPVADKTALLSDLKRQFNLQGDGDQLVKTNATNSNVQNVINDNKDVSQGLLDKLKGYTGDDILQGAQDARYGQAFQGGKMNGSRNTNMGGVVGGALGGFLGGPVGAGIGATAGAGAGYMVDKMGGQFAAKALDATLAGKQTLSDLAAKVPVSNWIGQVVKNNPQMFGPYAQTLRQALERGEESLAATHFVLEQRDPNYRQMLSGMSDASAR